MRLPVLNDYTLKARRVAVRVDMNVPMHEGKIADDQRIRASLPTIRRVLDAGGSAVVLSHLGRPKEGQFGAGLSLRPAARRLQRLLGNPVRFAEDYLGGLAVQPGEVVVCENVRFNKGEKSNDKDLSRALAALGDLFVMDAFACAHRAHASTQGAVACAERACAGPLLEKELSILGNVLEKWQRPVAAIIGGAKISSKFTTLSALANKVDTLVLGGGIANTVMASRGCPVGRSLVEKDWFDSARRLCHQAEQGGAKVHVPVDVICAGEVHARNGVCRKAADVQEQEMILDLGTDSIDQLHRCLRTAKTLLWSGPLGVFENPAFANGTEKLAQLIAASEAYSVAGGGDTLAAISRFGVGRGISHMSTGGGAFLHFIEGRELPAVAALKARQNGTMS